MARATRKQTDTDGGQLSKLESLLLAQAVYEAGTSSWSTIAKTLSKSHLVSRPKSFFTPASCQSMYTTLMVNAGLTIPEQTNSRAPVNLKLAERHFNERMQELQELIAAEETKFRSLHTEVRALQNHGWDDKLASEIITSPSQEPLSTSKTGDAAEDHDFVVEPKGRRSTRSSATTQNAARSTRRRRSLKSDVEVDTENDTLDERTEPGTPAVVLSRSASPTPSRRAEKRKAADTADSPRERKRQREESEPVDEEGPSSGTRRRRERVQPTEEQVASKKFQNVILLLLSQISAHRNGNIFHNPIKDTEAPDYSEIIKRPMDLKTIKTRIKDGLITNSLEFQRDIYLMFANAMMYNRPGSDIYALAEEMMLESEVQIQTFRQTEGLVRGSNRRA